MSIQSGIARDTVAPRKPQRLTTLARQRGVALFMGLIFLVMLTLVALIVLRDTTLEMRLTTATAQHEQAFEASEEARQVPEAILQAHVQNRGWPVSWGGTVPDAMFDLNTIYAGRTSWVALLDPTKNVGKGIQQSCTGTGLAIFYMEQTCTNQTASYRYTPSTWTSTPSVIFNVCSGGSTSCGSTSSKTTDTIAIVRDGTAINQGSGAASQQGYSSVGVGSSTGGSSLMLQVLSNAQIPGGSTDTTIAQYRLNISN
jgi:hypothetical protein